MRRIGRCSQSSLYAFSCWVYRQALKDHTSLGGKTMGFLAGLATGITEAVIIVTPFEVIKTRLQQQKVYYIFINRDIRLGANVDAGTG